MLRYSGPLEQGDTSTDLNHLEQARCPLHLPRGQAAARFSLPARAAQGPRGMPTSAEQSNSHCLSFRLLIFYRTSAQGTWRTALEPFYCCKQQEDDEDC